MPRRTNKKDINPLNQVKNLQTNAGLNNLAKPMIHFYLLSYLSNYFELCKPIIQIGTVKPRLKRTHFAGLVEFVITEFDFRTQVNFSGPKMFYPRYW